MKKKYKKMVETKKKKRITIKELEDIKIDTEIVSIQIYCGKLKKTVVIPWEDCKIDAVDSPCDLCGSHGHTRIDVKCECGMEHGIDTNTW